MVTPEQDFNPLGRLAGFVTLLAIALYFTGWIYRWTYYGFFKIQVTALGLPIESFYLAAFRVLYGNLGILLRTLVIFVILFFIIIISLEGFWRLLKVLQVGSLVQRLGRFQQYTSKFSLLFMNELIIVFWILTTLFMLAHHQAIADAWTDVVEESSQLPVVTTVIPETNAALGRALTDPFSDPSDFRILGDRALYRRILGQEVNETDPATTWRLLSAHDGYFFVFRTLPQRDDNKSVPILKIYESSNGDQLTILSPRAVN